MSELVRRTGWMAAATIFVLALSGAAFRVLGSEHGFGHASWAMVDFRSVAYYPVQAFLDGANPYSGEQYLAQYPASHPFTLYFPATLVLHLPFGLMPLSLASLAYVLVTIALTAILAVLAFRFNDLRASGAVILLTTGLILLSRPGHQNLLLGNVTLPAVLATYVAVRYAGHVPALSGLALAASLLKPNFGLPVAILMLVRGQWRAVLWGLGITAVVNLPFLPVLSARAGGVEPFFSQLLKTWVDAQSIPFNSPTDSLRRIDAVALFSRLLGTPLGAVGELVVTVSVLAIGAMALRAVDRAKTISDPRGREALALGIICVTTLLAVYHQSYDALLLTVPLVAAIANRVPPLAQMPQLRLTLLGLLAVLAVNYVSTESVIMAVHPSPPLWLILASINSIALALTMGLYVFLAMRGTAAAKAA